MKLIHPQEMQNGIRPEDIFYVLDDAGNSVGEGHVICQYRPCVYPDRPVNIYFTMSCRQDAEYLLLGSLAARARQMRQAYPNARARLYTSILPNDTRALAFYEHNGFDLTSSEDLVALHDPLPASAMFNCSIIEPAANTLAEQMGIVSRMQHNGLDYFDHAFLQHQLAMPNKVVLGMLFSQSLIGECVVAGRGSTAEVMGLYVVPEFQKRGMATRMLMRAQTALLSQGVEEIRMRVLSASEPQVRLVRHFQAELLEKTGLFPSLQI